MYDKDEIKNNLTIEQIIELVAELGGEPIKQNENMFTSRTICHNQLGEGSHKLYYYNNTKLFKCYTDCGDTFDIFQLVMKVKNLREEYIMSYTKKGMKPRKWLLPDALTFVSNYFGIESAENRFQEMSSKLPDWELFKEYEKRQKKAENSKQIVELKVYDDSILTHLPRPHILPWEREGIKYDVMCNRGIAYNPRTQGIVIPHYDIDGNLVGIRERTMIKEEEQFGKYRPSILNGQMYNHPLGFNLYNLNNSKNAIKVIKKAILFEGEKSPLLYASYFGEENDITVATCGNNLLKNQVSLLLSLGVEEIILAYDKQFKEKNDTEFKALVNKLRTLHTKYSSDVNLSFMFDKTDLLGYKDAPIDKGPEIFMKLFEERIQL